MRTAAIATLVSPATLALLIACQPEANPVGLKLQAMSFANSAWSEPVNLGPVVNSTAGDNNATLSPDGLSLYFASDRPGGLGAIDIWVARRASPDSPWEAPVHLGAPVSTASMDGAPVLSIDGHLLFLHSDRPGGQGGFDIWMAHRSDPKDDFSWEAPVNLGPDVNTPDGEQGPEYVKSDGGGALYFSRGDQLLQKADLYRAEVGPTGRTRGPALPVAELNDPTTNDLAPTVRTDGREIFFFSGRAGGFGGADIWVSTRPSVSDPWSPPENWGGPPFNTASADNQPDLSRDGRTLVFSSTRAGGFGGTDMWMSTRTVNGK